MIIFDLFVLVDLYFLADSKFFAQFAFNCFELMRPGLKIVIWSLAFRYMPKLNLDLIYERKLTECNLRIKFVCSLS